LDKRVLNSKGQPKTCSFLYACSKKNHISWKIIYQSELSPHYYLNLYWSKLTDAAEEISRSQKDTLNRLNGNRCCIEEHKWLLKSTYKVNELDMKDCFELLDVRGS
tara:strand:- start:359 stop:676 length:318 start_codon:yes stop_codon:yes gene_type:complete